MLEDKIEVFVWDDLRDVKKDCNPLAPLSTNEINVT